MLFRATYIMIYFEFYDEFLVFNISIISSLIRFVNNENVYF